MDVFSNKKKLLNALTLIVVLNRISNESCHRTSKFVAICNLEIWEA